MAAERGIIRRLNLKLDILTPKLVAEGIADLLREKIVSEKIPLGVKLLEEELSLALKVSRTPVRQAFKILELEGLVDLVPRRGAFVSRITEKDVQELFQILGMIESFSVRQVIATGKNVGPLEKILFRMAEQIEKRNLKGVIQANLAFHSTLVELAENRKLVALYNSARNPTRVYQSVGLSSHEYWRDSLQDHRQIVSQIRRGNAEMAGRHCLEHNLRKCSQIVSHLHHLQRKPH